MKKIRLLCAILGLVGVLLPLTWAGGDQDLAGTWRMVEQRYNGGGHNFAQGNPELRLTFVRTATGWTGRVRFEGRESAWPVWLAPDGPAPLIASRVTADADGAGVAAAYRVAPAPGDDTFLVVEEHCRGTSPGRMTCTLEVGFEREGVRRGGFTWERVFAREDR